MFKSRVMFSVHYVILCFLEQCYNPIIFQLLLPSSHSSRLTLITSPSDILFSGHTVTRVSVRASVWMGVHASRPGSCGRASVSILASLFQLFVRCVLENTLWQLMNNSSPVQEACVDLPFRLLIDAHAKPRAHTHTQRTHAASRYDNATDN